MSWTSIKIQIVISDYMQYDICDVNRYLQYLHYINIGTYVCEECEYRGFTSGKVTNLPA
jgi:hypothetical protein